MPQIPSTQPPEPQALTPAPRMSRLPKWLLWTTLIGPGLVVMLADTDAGSVITAAQSGAVWGYRLLALQFILIPILYLAQELTVRMGLVTQQGHGELIKTHFGKAAAWFSVGTLLVSCVGAILSEFSGIAGVGALFGVPLWFTMVWVVAFLVLVAWTGSYHSVERIALLMGAFELVFVVVAWKAHPSLAAVKEGLKQMPITHPGYLYLAAANVGAVVMPWMIFYQQSAVLDKGLTVKHLRVARWDTMVGAVVTQVIMAAVLMVTAATIGQTNPNAPLNTVQQIVHGLVPFLGNEVGRVLFSLGMLGAALVATVVVSLTASWGLGEVMGFKRSLEHRPKQAPWFYGIYTVVLVVGGIIVASGVNLVNLSVGVEVMNALLLPIVLGFLILLARKSLPEKYRLKGVYGTLITVILAVTAGFGLVAGIYGAFN